ncbi:hypothetical protein RintRC_0505 [Richelia intracellularis]|nr:hypothetical protein RintRC_0505 [Richelia intracellularis]
MLVDGDTSLSLSLSLSLVTRDNLHHSQQESEAIFSSY